MDRPPLSGRGRGKVRLVLVIGAVGLVGWHLPFGDGVESLAATFWVSWVVCLALLAWGHPQHCFRPSAAYLLVFGLFHGGLLLGIAVEGADAFAVEDTWWIYDVHTPQAVSLVIAGMASFTLLAGLADRGVSAVRPPDTVGSGALGLTGLAVQAAGLGIFGAVVLASGGAGLLSGGYTAFVEANQSDTTLAFGTLFVGLGAVLAVAAGGRSRVGAWIGFAAYAVVAFPIGERGEVLFLLLAMLAIETRRRRLRPLWTVVGVVGTLFVSGLVRQTRLHGFAALSGSSWPAMPFDAVAEMGHSLRPSVVVVGWSAAGEPFRDGATLVVVPVRFVESLVGWHGGPPAYDDRLFNVEIATRVGQIGGSPVAESFYNFGAVGVLLFMACCGAVLGWLEGRVRTPWADAALGVVLLPLLMQVRNSFAPVPVQLALGLMFVGGAHVIARRHGATP
jgi:hypothetical protein